MNRYVIDGKTYKEVSMDSLYRDEDEPIGIPPMKSYKEENKGPVVLSKQDRLDIHKMYKADIKTSKIAYVYGCGQARINIVLREAGEEIGAKRGRGIGQKKVDEVLRLRNKGKSYRAIARETEVSYSTIGSICRRGK